MGGGRKNKELKILWFNSLLHKGDLEGSSSLPMAKKIEMTVGNKHWSSGLPLGAEA